MAIDQRKRQKALAKKAAKRKAKKQNLKTHANPSKLQDATIAARYPVHECLVPAELFETGIGSIVFSRKMPDGDTAFAVFLLDVFCLGAKNAYYQTSSQLSYEGVLDQINANETLVETESTCVRKLVEACVQYAKELGFDPHSDYKIARQIFGDTDAAACSERFEFGREGKPFYASGPHESPARVKAVIQQLTEKCGPDGFHYLAGIGPGF